MKKFLVSLVAMMVVLTGCDAEIEKPTSSSFKVMTTIPPLYSLASHLVEGTTTTVENIVPPNTSVHSFQLTPRVAKSIEYADLIVVNGLELETFLEDTLSSKQNVVDTSKGVKTLKFAEEASHDDHGHKDHDDHHDEDDHEKDHHGHEDEHHDDEDSDDDHKEEGHSEHAHAHGEYDPHIWLVPENAELQAKNIMDALVAADSKNAETYKKNFESLKEELEALDKELAQRVAALEVKPFIVFHDAYQYFEKHYNVKAKAHLEEFPGKNPSAQYLAKVVDLIEDHGVKVLFSEPQFSPKLAETIAKDYSLEVGTLDPLGTEISKDGYFVMMRSNVSSLEKFFKK